MFCWQGLVECVLNGIPQFLEYKQSAALKVQGGKCFGELWCIWIFSGDFRGGNFMRSEDGCSWD